jgi:hypothetical protein
MGKSYGHLRLQAENEIQIEDGGAQTFHPQSWYFHWSSTFPNMAQDYFHLICFVG